MPTNTLPIDTEATAASGEWEQYRDELLQNAEAREEYERTLHRLLAFRQILQRVECERERAGLSKAELAHRIGMNPSAVRRLLTAETSNPTFKTMLGLFDALGLEMSLRPAQGAMREERLVPTDGGAEHEAARSS